MNPVEQCVKCPHYDPNIRYCGPSSNSWWCQFLCKFIPSKWGHDSWNHDCYEHDCDYSKGGTWFDKVIADLKLGFRILVKAKDKSVLMKARHIFLSIVYFTAVVHGGAFCFSWRNKFNQTFHVLLTVLVDAILVIKCLTMIIKYGIIFWGHFSHYFYA